MKVFRNNVSCKPFVKFVEDAVSEVRCNFAAGESRRGQPTTHCSSSNC